jgi:GTPase SAR1 family protein
MTTMTEKRIEIKVALLGNVSAGKTTVLNAILQNKYGEVAKKRTTAGINYFYLNVSSDKKGKRQRSAESIHDEITADNKKKVRDGHDIIQKVFEIDIPEPIVRCHSDTILVLVDIPGINEAGTENKYKDFVSNNWKTFDCVIVVMDGKQGVNSEDQVFLLQFVKKI